MHPLALGNDTDYAGEKGDRVLQGKKLEGQLTRIFFLTKLPQCCATVRHSLGV